jgi:hypothetical protein
MKKQYIIPQTEQVRLDSGEIMEVFHQASMPKDPLSSAPKRRAEVF